MANPDPFVLRPDDVVMPGTFKEQTDVPLRNGTGGPILGKCHIHEDGTADIELNAAGLKLFKMSIDTTGVAMRSMVIPALEKGNDND